MANPLVQEVTEQNFQSFLAQSNEKLVVLDFWAEWCAPCKMLGPILERIVSEFAGRVVLGKINTETQQGLAQAFRIQSIPFVVMFKDGQPVDHFVGVQPEPQIRAKIEKYAPSPAEDELESGEELAQAGRWPEAEVTFDLAYKEDPNNTDALVGLIRAMVALGRHHDARAMWDQSGKQSATIDRLFDVGDLWNDAAGMSPDQLLNPTDDLTKDKVQRIIQSAVIHARKGDERVALEMMLKAVALDKNWRDQLPRRAMLALFALFGEKRDMIREYRGKMATLLY